MHEIISALLLARKTVKLAAANTKARSLEVLVAEEVLRNAMGYAWEVGAGQKLAEKVILTESNPFNALDWRTKVIASD